MDRFPEDILGTYFNIHSLKSFWKNNCNEINLYKQCLCSHLVSSISQPQLAYMSSVVDLQPEPADLLLLCNAEQLKSDTALKNSRRFVCQRLTWEAADHIAQLLLTMDMISHVCGRKSNKQQRPFTELRNICTNTCKRSKCDKCTSSGL